MKRRPIQHSRWKQVKGKEEGREEDEKELWSVAEIIEVTTSGMNQPEA